MTELDAVCAMEDLVKRHGVRAVLLSLRHVCAMEMAQNKFDNQPEDMKTWKELCQDLQVAITVSNRLYKAEPSFSLKK